MEGKSSLKFDSKKFIQLVKEVTKMKYGKSFAKADKHEQFYAVAMAAMELLAPNWEQTTKAYSQQKQASYLSAEFLMGRALGNNLLNLGLYKDVKKALDKIGFNLNTIEEAEEDAGLGNGGLGRLAACFLDSAASEDIPLTGYGIRYDYGIFKQKFEVGRQVELVDNWLKYGDPWSVRKDAEKIIIDFADQQVLAVPYDSPIIGYNTNNINTLRLWKAEPIEPFDYQLFNAQEYEKAVEKKNSAEDISRVLYPNDSTNAGKMTEQHRHSRSGNCPTLW